MPIVTKLLFITVGLGLALFVVLAFRHGQAVTPQHENRIEPIGKRRYNQLWVVDRPDDDE